MDELQKRLSVYVHPVVRDGDADSILNSAATKQSKLHNFEKSMSISDLFGKKLSWTSSYTSSDNALNMKNRKNQNRAEAELRSVYVMFIMPIIESKLTGKRDSDEQYFTLLNAIMNVVMRELNRYKGHLRQFIVDDKGVVLIGTFGLRGSAFLNM